MKTIPLFSQPMRWSLCFLLFTTVACAVQHTSRFADITNLMGSDEHDIIDKFGKPYKVAVSTRAGSVQSKDLYYKEQLFLKKWYDVTTVLHFTNGKLSGIEPADEKPTYPEATVSVRPASR